MRRKRAVRPGDLTSAGARKRQLQRLYEKYKGICQLCDKFCHPAQASRDHVVELCLGGTSDDSNMVLAHKKCNEEKSKEVSRQKNLKNNPKLMKRAEDLPQEWWDKILTKQIWGTVYRIREGGPISGSVPLRLKNDDTFCLPIR